jgi:2-hydroxychromene-2-carboxylate isomerase
MAVGPAISGTGVGKDPGMADVIFFFDPECPWTWRAFRWLVEVARPRGLTVEWRPLSLAVLNEGDVPDQYRTVLEASHRALRLVEALRRAGHHDDVARFYTEIGTRAHERDESFTDELVGAAAEAAGVAGDLAALDDTGLDAAVQASTEAAVAAAGPGVGSPVLQLPGVERGLHGPILGEVPGEKDALALWDAIETLIHMSAFYEVKRGRQ